MAEAQPWTAIRDGRARNPDDSGPDSTGFARSRGVRGSASRPVPVIAHQRPTGQHNIPVASQILPPPLLRILIVPSAGCPGNHSRKRTETLVLRKEEQMMLVKVRLDGNIKINPGVFSFF